MIMARIFTTAMGLLIIGTVLAVLFNFWADGNDAYRKDAFNGSIGLSAAWFALGMVFIGKQHAKGNRIFTPINLNVLGCGAAIAFLLGTGLPLHAVAVAAEGGGAIVGAAVSTAIGGYGSLTMALAKRDDEE